MTGTRKLRFISRTNSGETRGDCYRYNQHHNTTSCTPSERQSLGDSCHFVIAWLLKKTSLHTNSQTDDRSTLPHWNMPLQLYLTLNFTRGNSKLPSKVFTVPAFSSLRAETFTRHERAGAARLRIDFGTSVVGSQRTIWNAPLSGLPL